MVVASLVAVQQQQQHHQTSSSTSGTSNLSFKQQQQQQQQQQGSSSRMPQSSAVSNFSNANPSNSPGGGTAGRGRIGGRGNRKRQNSRGNFALSDSGRTLAQQQQQQQPPSTVPPEKPCHSARLALLCAQNAAQMGARTQLALCPPGRNRRLLQSALRQKNLERQQQLQNMSVTLRSNGASAGLEKLIGMEQLEDYEVQEEDFLMNYQSDSDEEASDGDEDELLDIDYMFSEESIDLDDETRYRNCPESLYVPVSAGEVGQQGSKLPFNRRKLRYFDAPTADEAVITRAYCKKEMQRSKQRAAQALCRMLKKKLTDSASTNSSRRRMEDDEESTANNAVTPFEPTMTPAMAASLLMESLMVNAYESVEGIAACYDGIVAAGVALLEVPDPTQPSKARASRSEIMAALAPLLITTLEQPSGEVILLLARLRRMCGTVRYQRRFVQRIAPALIRPPGAAMWCLRHQNDMEAVLAATELILDAAFDVFAKGWYDRGRWMLADSKRAETLSAAAQQLRNLSQEPPDGLAFLHRRRHISSTHEAEPLAEWEVIAVDRQIRISISSVLQTDWTKATEKVHEAFPRPMRQHRGSKSGSSNSAALALASPRATPRSPRQSSRLSFMDDSQRAVSPPPPEASLSISPNNSLANNNSMPPPKSPKSPHRGLHHSASGGSVTSSDNVMSPKRSLVHLSTPLLTPLSPSASSVGSTGPNSVVASAAQNSDMIAYRPAVSASTGTTSTGAPAAHYRMLTSTAAERKRTVAACRALRAQISRFEDAFIQMHGRPPKGAADRAPLATTYAQYREWKRAIRADAACRIQALFRGYNCRSKLLSLNNVIISRIIRKKPGASNRPFLPKDLGLSPPDSTNPSSGPTGGVGQVPVGSPKAGANQWPGARGGSPPASPTPYSPSSPVQLDPNMSIADLLARKRDLKQQLKQYDMNFARRHGRMPVKAEKEPIRHLYEAYNILKSQITQMEREGRHLPGIAVAPAPASQQRTVSPPSGSEGSEDSAAGARISPNPLPRNKRKLPKPASSSSGASTATGSTTAGSTVASVPMSAGAAGSINSTVPSASSLDGLDLAALKAEKSSLHTMLRSYEKDFFRENNRQVSSFADIQPVASQYRRYKEIKKAIAARQQQQGGGGSS